MQPALRTLPVRYAAPGLLFAALFAAPSLQAAQPADDLETGLDRICLPYVEGSVLDGNGELDHETVLGWTQTSNYRVFAPRGPFTIKLVSESSLANGTPPISITLDAGKNGRTCLVKFVDENSADPLADIKAGFEKLGIAGDSDDPDEMEFHASDYGRSKQDLIAHAVLTGRRVTIQVQGN